MFDGGDDDVRSGYLLVRRVHSQDWLCHQRIEDAEDGVVVGFGAAAGEDDFLGMCADESGDLFTGGFNGGASALAGSVDRGGVAKVGGEIGEHGVENLRVDGGRGVVIEVDAVHGTVLRILLEARRRTAEDW